MSVAPVQTGPRGRHVLAKPMGLCARSSAFEFAYVGGGLGKGGKGTLFVNGQQVAQSRIDRTEAMVFSADETADVGIDVGTPVVEAIGAEAKSRFTGHIRK